MNSELNICFENVAPRVAKILSKALEGNEISAEEGTVLMQADSGDLDAVIQVANYFRESKRAKATSFVVTRNINFTNVCHMGCAFCGFAKHKTSPQAELLSMEEIARRVVEASERGATEICIQGGLHPKINGDHYRNIVKTAKAAAPSIHLHAFSPFEIYFGSRKSKMSYSDFLTDLKECGLGSIPGTAAEILDKEVRLVLTKDKLSAKDWVEIIKAAHGVGLPSTSTMMYGHVDEPKHWANHIALLRDIQKQTGGFTEFVPPGFVHYDSPLYLQNRNVRPEPTRQENIVVHAVARIMLNGYIDNIQASWVKLGPKFAQESLGFGVNDLGGTLMNESISRAAGALYGQEITATEMTQMITSAGYDAVQRNTLYGSADKPQHKSADLLALTESQLPLIKRSEWQAEQIEARSLEGPNA